jgi:hypothetical protein
MDLDYQRQQKSEHDTSLQVLSIFQYIVAALIALCSSFFLFYVAMGVVVLKNPGIVTPPPGSASLPMSPTYFGWAFFVIGCVPLVLGWSLAVAVAVTGYKLYRRKSRVFCIVVASFECLFFPFGTILGVFTIVVLSKDPVKPLFAS